MATDRQTQFQEFYATMRDDWVALGEEFARLGVGASRLNDGRILLTFLPDGPCFELRAERAATDLIRVERL